MAAGLELPEHVFVHGYLLMEGEKMSKSLGNVLDPFEVIERFGADALRFYLLRDVSFGQDGSVSTAAFEQRYETELANELGNLANRTISMLLRYRDGVVSQPVAIDPALAADFAGLPEQVAALIDRAELTVALEEIWQRVRRLNRYVEERAPFRLAKDERRRRRAEHGARQPRRGPALRDGAAVAVPARTRPGGCCRRSAPPTRRWREPPWAAGRIERVSAIGALFPKDAGGSRSRRDRLAHPPRPVRAAGRRARRRRGAGGRAADRDGRYRRRLVPRGAGRRRGLPAGLRRRSGATRTPPRGFDDADLAELEALAAHRALRGDRRDGTRLLPRRDAAR